MKTSITITGQINGNFTLRSKLMSQPFKTELRTLPFNGFEISFGTKKEAKKALWNTYRELRSDADTKDCTSYSKYGSLRYDASSATINDGAR